MFRIKPATRYPADPRAVFILSLAIVTGLPMLALKIRPDSLEALLPSWVVFCWALLLVVGAGVTLAGMMRQTVTGIIAEQVGSVITGCATIFYAAAIYLTVGPDSLLSVAIIVGFGLSCFYRYGQLQSLLAQSQKIVDEVRDRNDR